MSNTLSSSHVTLAPGVIIDGKYRIDDVLGEGGMGLVWSATHLVLDAPVAIKVVREELASNEEIISRLLFEARASARMRSQHIVRVLDVARLATGTPYIVMERLEGSDLGELIESRGPLPVPFALSCLLQVCEGLAEAHSLGIIHRDLKPENLFLANTPEGAVVKILDFGISKNVGTSITSTRRTSLTSADSIAGSPSYMSPEQLRALPSVDARADIWSLGAILYEFLTAHCPFEADTAATLCVKVITEEAPSLLDFSAELPPALDSVVRRCLRKDPNARFQSVLELSAVLRDIADALARPEQPRPLVGAARARTDSSIDSVAPSSWAADPSDESAAQPFEAKAPRRSRRSRWQVFAAGSLALLAAFAAHPYSRHEAASWLGVQLVGTEQHVALTHTAEAPRLGAPRVEVRAASPAPPPASAAGTSPPVQKYVPPQPVPAPWVHAPASHAQASASAVQEEPAPPLEESEVDEEMAAPPLPAIGAEPATPLELPAKARAAEPKLNAAPRARHPASLDSRAAGARYGL